MNPHKIAVLILFLLMSFSGIVNAEEPLWTQSTDHEICCLELAPNASYVVAGGERIYCMDREGNLLWHENSGDDLHFIRGGSIIAGLRNNFLQFIDLEGEITRREEISDDVIITDIVGISDDGNEYYLLGTNGVLYGKNGDESLEATIEVMDFPSNVVMTWNAVRLVAIEEDGLYCYSPRSGSRRWQHPARGEKAIFTEDGEYVVYGAGNRIYEISVLHGEAGEREELWETKIDGDVLSLDASTPDNGTHLIAVGTRDATHYSTDNYVYLLDSDGHQKWRNQCGFWIYAIDITPSGNYIAAGSLEKKVFVFDGEGNLCNEIDTSEPVKFVTLNEEENFGVAADAHNVYGFTLERETPSVEEENVTPAAPSTPAAVHTTTQPTTPPEEQPKLVDRGDGGAGTPPVSRQSGASGIFLEVRSALVSFFRGLFSPAAQGS